MKAKEIKLASEDTLKTNIGKLKQEIASKVIEWTNAAGKTVSCSFAAFGHTGKLTVTRETDKAMFDAAVAVFQKTDSEKRAKAASGVVATVKAGHSEKLGTCSVTERMTGILASKANVTTQLANAQKMAQLLRDLQAELLKRAELEREAKAKAERDAKVKEAEDYLNGAPGKPSTFVPVPAPALTEVEQAEVAAELAAA